MKAYGLIEMSQDTMSENVNSAVNGMWSLWTEWQQCPVSCGDGFQTRSRTCTNPEPQHGGLSCAGDDQEPQGCSTGVTCEGIGRSSINVFVQALAFYAQGRLLMVLGVNGQHLPNAQ